MKRHNMHIINPYTHLCNLVFPQYSAEFRKNEMKKRLIRNRIERTAQGIVVESPTGLATNSPVAKRCAQGIKEIATLFLLAMTLWFLSEP